LILIIFIFYFLFFIFFGENMNDSNDKKIEGGEQKTAPAPSANNDNLLWPDIIDRLAKNTTILTLQPTQYASDAIDGREIVAINRNPLEFPVPIDALGQSNPNAHVQKVEKTLLDVHKIVSDGVDLRREDLLFDTQGLRSDIHQQHQQTQQQQQQQQQQQNT